MRNGGVLDPVESQPISALVCLVDRGADQPLTFISSTHES
jgi:hypothetical protein